ncbi:hypothetical protein HPB48_012894 [Haemaphysalis longicornis]|uniref:Uncharacterized protein n=1 Tax=Haemaphysalis longicornis TaxID=44386 RepID=A0A9J6GGN6_HAELO|nr:hypothetical protein HPB48_012894 [Haemaphysalis longicornis]
MYFKGHKSRDTRTLKHSQCFIFRFYGHYTLDMIAKCAFGTKLDSHTDATNEFVTEAGKAFTTKGSLTVLLGGECEL